MSKIGLGFGAAALAVAVALSATGAYAQSDAGVKVGMLACNVSSGWGVIFGSTRDVHCTYQPVKGQLEHYYGHISKFGVDIGYTKGGVMVWAVFAPTSDLESGALSGRYVGATASATVGVGAGVNALVGGMRRSVSLQPVSIEGNTGLNVAGGVAEMTLKHG
ncbi:MAG TPA: DUF992 domain-containing protein [Rhizomicrobium sp.]|nr:DUF992 domain-containing protein [Rhizomicrobium sp.]